MIDEIPETLPESVLDVQSVNITKYQDVLDYFHTDRDHFCGSWYARWYVIDENGVKQSISSSKSTTENWSVTNYQNDSSDWPTDNWQVSDNTVYCSSKVQNGNWYITEVFARNTRIAAPNGTTLGDYPSYKIVLEVTNEYSGGEPDIKVRYTFSIPIADEFLAKKASGADSKTETKDVAKSAKKYTLENMSAAEYANVKYARIYVANSSGQAQDFTGKLKVTYDGATTNVKDAGAKAKNGKYIYTGADLDLSKIKVKIGEVEAGTLPNYQIVCLLANNTTGMTDDGVGTITHEPDWGYEYVVKFQSPARFTHYKGCTGRDYEVMSGATEPGVDTWEDGIVSKSVRQSVHTVEYDIYVAEGGTILLELPFMDAWNDYSNDGNQGYAGNPNEPREYVRWYDYNTDYAHENLKPYNESLEVKNAGGTVVQTLPEYALLKDRFFDNGKSRGLMSWFPDRVMFNYNNWFNDRWHTNKSIPPTKMTTAVTKFTRPSDASWKQTDIACDVSRYRDGIDTESCELIHEPTLSVRYIWHIHPAKELADKIKKAVKEYDSLDDNAKQQFDADGFRPLEDGGMCSIGLNDGKVAGNLHLALQDVDDYWFYPFVEKSDHKGGMKGSWGTELCRATGVVWRVYSQDHKYYQDYVIDKDHAERYDGKRYVENGINRPNGNMTRFFKYAIGFNFTGAMLNDVCDTQLTHNLDSIYKEVGGSGTKNVSFKSGDLVTIVGYVKDDAGHMAPVCRNDMYLVEGTYPMLDNSSLPYDRRQDWLETNYEHVGTISFDGEEGSTDSYPTNPRNNMNPMPLKWSFGHYGFCYPDLHDQCQVFTYMGITPIHGEYGLFKTKNAGATISCASDVTGDDGGPMDVDGIKTQYCWYVGGEMHDRTYEMTNAAKSGYFLYIDASDESRSIADISFETELCSGSAIVFTADVANMTPHETTPYGADHSHLMTPPQLLCQIYGIVEDEHGKEVSRELIQSFTTGDFNSVGATESSKWYQMYARSVLTNPNMSTFSKYTLVLDNYCDNTDGADYAVDNIRVYIKRAKAAVVQANASCDDDGVKTQFEIPHQTLQTLRNNTDFDINYRICEEDGTVVTEGIPTGFYEEGENYGIAHFKKDFLNGRSTVDHQTAEKQSAALEETYTYRYDSEGNQEFVIARGTLKLTPGIIYYLSVSTDGGLTYGHPTNLCSTYSELFSPQRQTLELKIPGLSSERILMPCGVDKKELPVDAVLKVPNQETHLMEIAPEGSVHFDWTVSEDKEGATLTYFPNTMSFQYEFESGKTYRIQAVPVETKVTIKGVDYVLCTNGFTFVMSVAPQTPVMELGFDDMDYTVKGRERIIRVGLEQLDMMMHKGYLLHIPVSQYKNKAQGTSKKLYFPEDHPYLTVSRTNDPTLDLTSGEKKFAKIVGLTAGERPYVNKNRMYMPLDLSVCNVVFHEGYEYEVSTSFVDEDDLAEDQPCLSDLYMVIKVVPEFVTWNAVPEPNDHYDGLYSANWYNDANWSRSTRAELYKDANGESARQNTPTVGHPEGYDNNGEGSLAAFTPTLMAGKNLNPGFVPMKFTNVILPTGNHAPSLINEPKVYIEGVTGSARQGGGFLDTNQTTLLTDCSPNVNKEPSHPTKYIYYDMLVRYGKHEDGGVGCFGHRYLKEDGSWDDHAESPELPDAKVFDVEKYYGNVCRDIYFRPGSEILRQHRLIYERAWVEMELQPNKWYLLSAPLKDTYAGDMYVPAEMNDVRDNSTVVGRQLTEAFQPIKFGTEAQSANRTAKLTSQPAYSRTEYPIYQRSWGDNNGEVYTKTGDVRANSYTANLGYTSVSGVATEWGHTFNDVQVPYTALSGFSIRTHRKDQTMNTLIRLPKADDTYNYYDWSDTSSDPAAGSGIKKVTKGHENRFVTDDHENDGELTARMSDLQQIGDYVLVGNPYLCTIEMSKFFDVNPGLEKGYWTYQASVASGDLGSPLTEGYIRPLQAFFVKKGTATSIKFTRGMQIDGNFPKWEGTGSNTNPARKASVTLTATNGSASSKARVEMNDSASEAYDGGEDLTALFDSNLGNVPTVFTIAEGGQALSIDARPTMDIVPFGVACAASDELVDVSVDASHLSLLTSHLSPLTSHLYLLDAVTGDVTEVGEGGTFTVQPNDYGRYFLTTRGDLTAIGETKATESIVVSVRGKAVTVRSAQELKSVRVLTTGGAVVGSVADGGREATVHVNVGGVYVVEAQTADCKKSVKVVVK